MRFETTFFVLLFFLLCLCDGAPPREGIKKQPPRYKYTDEEKQLVVEELLKLFDDHKSKNSRALWKKVAEKLNEKWKLKTYGFPQERSAEGLRISFHDALKKHKTQNEILLPERLRHKLTELDQDKTKRGLQLIRSNSYRPQEEKIIFDELLKPSCDKILQISTLRAIHEKLNENHQAKVHGFEHERTLNSIRLHVSKLRDRGRFPPEIVKKFPLLQEDFPATSNAPVVSESEIFPGDSSSNIPSPNPQPDPQIANAEDDDEWIRDMIEELKNKPDVDIDCSILELFSNK